MSLVMMALGDYRFALRTAAYQSLRRQNQYRWHEQATLGQAPTQHYSGPGTETLEIEGVIYPHFRGGLGQIDRLRDQAGKGHPLPLILADSQGRSWGHFVITSIEETWSGMDGQGQPRKIGFRLSLSRHRTQKELKAWPPSGI